MTPKAPFLKYDTDLRQAAARFLAKHHADGSLPVPIEEIIEFDFKMDIVPMPGMHQAFDVDSFISHDLTEIRVDQGVYDSRPTRYRFSLAHELSHRLLHADIFSELSFTTVSEWKDVLSSIPAKDYRIIEWQANSLAGLILAPQLPLAAAFDEAKQMAETADFSLDDPAAIEHIEYFIAKNFEVSSAVIHRRLEYDGLI